MHVWQNFIFMDHACHPMPGLPRNNRSPMISTVVNRGKSTLSTGYVCLYLISTCAWKLSRHRLHKLPGHKVKMVTYADKAGQLQKAHAAHACCAIMLPVQPEAQPQQCVSEPVDLKHSYHKAVLSLPAGHRPGDHKHPGAPNNGYQCQAN